MRLKLTLPVDGFEDEVAIPAVITEPRSVTFNPLVRRAELLSLTPRGFARPLDAPNQFRHASLPILPPAYRDVTEKCSRLNITPPSPSSADRTVWISTVVESITFALDPTDAYFADSGDPDDDLSSVSEEDRASAKAAGGLIRLRLVSGATLHWPIDVQDASLPVGQLGLRHRLLKHADELRDAWIDLADIHGDEVAHEALHTAAECLDRPPAEWEDDSIQDAVKLLRKASAELFECWRRFILPTLKAELAPTYVLFAIQAAIRSQLDHKTSLLRKYALIIEQAFPTLDLELERWVKRTLGKALDFEDDSQECVGSKRIGDSPEPPSKRRRVDDESFVSCGKEVDLSLPPPLSASARLVLKSKSNKKLDKLDRILMQVEKADNRLLKLAAAFNEGDATEMELQHKITVQPIMLAQAKLDKAARAKQVKLVEATKNLKHMPRKRSPLSLTPRFINTSPHPLTSLMPTIRQSSSPRPMPLKKQNASILTSPPSAEPTRSPLSNLSTHQHQPSFEESHIRSAFGGVRPSLPHRPRSRNNSPTPESVEEEDEGCEQVDDSAISLPRPMDLDEDDEETPVMEIEIPQPVGSATLDEEDVEMSSEATSPASDEIDFDEEMAQDIRHALSSSQSSSPLLIMSDDSTTTQSVDIKRDFTVSAIRFQP